MKRKKRQDDKKQYVMSERRREKKEHRTKKPSLYIYTDIIYIHICLHILCIASSPFSPPRRITRMERGGEEYEEERGGKKEVKNVMMRSTEKHVSWLSAMTRLILFQVYSQD